MCQVYHNISSENYVCGLSKINSRHLLDMKMIYPVLTNIYWMLISGETTFQEISLFTSENMLVTLDDYDKIW